MNAATMTCVTQVEAEQGLCNQCLDVWPVDELGEDANGDAICVDCVATNGGQLDEDAAAYRSYCYAGR